MIVLAVDSVKDCQWVPTYRPLADKKSALRASASPRARRA